MIKQIFYSGSNEDFIQKLRRTKKEKLKYFRISSEIKDYSHVYEFWFDFITTNGQKISSEKLQIDCTTICDEKGYVLKSQVQETFKKLFEEQLTQKIN